MSRQKKGFFISLGMNIIVDAILIIVLTMIILSIVDVISGYRLGFLSLMGLR